MFILITSLKLRRFVEESLFKKKSPPGHQKVNGSARWSPHERVIGDS